MINNNREDININAKPREKHIEIEAGLVTGYLFSF